MKDERGLTKKCFLKRHCHSDTKKYLRKCLQPRTYKQYGFGFATQHLLRKIERVGTWSRIIRTAF